MPSGNIQSTPYFVTAEGERTQATPVRLVSRLRPIFPLSILLFALWVVLSGKFDAFHLGIGAASALGIALGTQRLLLAPPAIGPIGLHPLAIVPWFRMLGYLPWLFGQVVLASVEVAVIVVRPKMPIHPHIVRVRTQLPHTLARLTLAHSITLTPGTVTLDAQDDVLLVHALTERSASGLVPPQGVGGMQQRVAALFNRSGSPTPRD